MGGNGNGVIEIYIVDENEDGQADYYWLDQDENGRIDTVFYSDVTEDEKNVDIWLYDDDEDGEADVMGSHVPHKSLNQGHAAFMPDAIWAVSRVSPRLLPG